MDFAIKKQIIQENQILFSVGGGGGGGKGKKKGKKKPKNPIDIFFNLTKKCILAANVFIFFSFLPLGKLH